MKCEQVHGLGIQAALDPSTYSRRRIERAVDGLVEPIVGDDTDRYRPRR
jgi:hypothetical protein